MALILGSCRLAGSENAAPAPPVQSNNKIVFGAVWEPVGFYPVRAIDSASYYAQSLVYEGLVKYDSDQRIVPALAKSFSLSDDGRTYTFILRENLKFSDGSAVSLDDVIESFKVAIARGSPFRSDYADVAGYAKQGAGRLIVKLSHANAAFLSRLAELKILPGRQLGSSKSDSGSNSKSNPKSTDEWNSLMRHPVGTGPYMLSRWEAGLELTFVPNPYYWAQPPALDALIWRVVPDKTLLALALNRGEIDVAPVDPQSWDRLLVRNPNLTLARFYGCRTIYMGFNLSKMPFAQLDFRKAICLAIDKESIVKSLYCGYAHVPASDAPKGAWFFNAKVKPMPYNPVAARAMLKVAAQQQGGALPGFRIETLKDFQEIAQVVSNNLEKVGLRNEAEIVEYTTFKRNYLQSGAFSTFIFSRSAGPDPECGIVWGLGAPLNYVRFENKALSELLEQGRRSLVREDRAQIYGHVQEILADQVPCAFLAQPDLLIAYTRRCHNINRARQTQPSLPWDNPLFNAPYWYVDRCVDRMK